MTAKRAIRLGQNPLMHALLLEARNRLFAFGGAGRWPFPPALFIVLAGGAGTAVIASAGFLPGLIQEASRHVLTVSVLIALHNSMVVWSREQLGGLRERGAGALESALAATAT